MALEMMNHPYAFEKQIAPNARIVSDNDELYAGEDLVEVLYTPICNFFKESEGGLLDLSLIGGFNGWDGSTDEEFSAPLVPCVEAGSSHVEYRCTLYIPNFARRLNFLVTDGVRWDPTVYEVMVHHVREANPEADGTVLTFRQLDDGTLVPTGAEIRNDPLELDRRMQSAAVDKDLESVREGLREDAPSLDWQMRENEKEKDHRAVAALVGEELKMGNIVVAEARQAFDAYADAADTKDSATEGAPSLLSFEGARSALADVGLDCDSKTLQDIVEDIRRDHGDEADEGYISLPAFLRIYNALDEMGVGINIL